MIRTLSFAPPMSPVVLMGGLLGLSILTGATEASAARHRDFRPIRTTQALPTFKNRQVVGQMVFSTTYFSPTAKQPKPLMTTLRFRQKAPPRIDWVGRAYFPCTLGQARASLARPTRNHKLVDIVYLKGKGVPSGQKVIRMVSPLRRKEWAWNTVIFSGKNEMNRHLRSLRPGNYEMTVWTQYEQDRRVRNRVTGRTEWQPAHDLSPLGQLGDRDRGALGLWANRPVAS